MVITKNSTAASASQPDTSGRDNTMNFPSDAGARSRSKGRSLSPSPKNFPSDAGARSRSKGRSLSSSPKNFPSDARARSRSKGRSLSPSPNERVSRQRRERTTTNKRVFGAAGGEDTPVKRAIAELHKGNSMKDLLLREAEKKQKVEKVVAKRTKPRFGVPTSKVKTAKFVPNSNGKGNAMMGGYVSPGLQELKQPAKPRGDAESQKSSSRPKVRGDAESQKSSSRPKVRKEAVSPQRARPPPSAPHPEVVSGKRKVARSRPVTPVKPRARTSPMAPAHHMPNPSDHERINRSMFLGKWINASHYTRGWKSVPAQAWRLAKRLDIVHHHEERIQLFRSMAPMDVYEWILSIPSQTLPDNARYNKILDKLAELCVAYDVDGLAFDEIIQRKKLDKFKVQSAHSSSFIGKVITNQWLKTFYSIPQVMHEEPPPPPRLELPPLPAPLTTTITTTTMTSPRAGDGTEPVVTTTTTTTSLPSIDLR